LARDHDVTLLSFVRPTDSPAAMQHLESTCQAVHTVPMPRSPARDAWHLVRSLAGPLPFLIARDWVPTMARAVRSLLGQADPPFDAVHADQLWMAPYALLAQEAPSVGRPFLVLDQHNAVFQVPRRLTEHEPNGVKRALLALEVQKLKRFEARICRRFDHVVWVSEEDRGAVDAVTPQSTASLRDHRRSTVIPICVDPDEQPVVPRRADAHRVTFLGGLHWPPNAAGIVWFAREIWPRVRSAIPSAVLTVIGKDPSPALLAVAEQTGGIDVPGYVDVLAPYLADTAAFVVPLQAGGGVRVKILDAWCWGLPVVSTAIGAEGLAARGEENLLLGDTPSAFAEATIRILREPELSRRLAAEGRRTVESTYAWRTIYRQWRHVYAGQTTPDQTTPDQT
jgi:glycosyltransferase involved in cell wall biosynthesis